MKKLTKDQFKTIQNWIYRNARPLEFARWRYHFEGGGRDEVIKILSAYQNPDGGFGHKIEADSWNPNSSPISTSTAMSILNEIGFDDKEHPMIKDILRYLEQTSNFTGRYWPAVIPSNNDYPHAPWWTYNDNFEADWGYNPTAKIAGFILRFADQDSNIYKKAHNIANEATDKYMSGLLSDGKLYRDVHREGEAECLYHLIEALEDREISDVCNVSELKDILKRRVYEIIDRDPKLWSQYTHKPSMFITSPESLFYKGNEEVMNTELDYIIDNLNDKEVWDINWSWGMYDKEFAISENWWKGSTAILTLLLLRNFDRL